MPFAVSLEETQRNISTLSSEVSKHLQNVYLTLLATIIASASGMAFYLLAGFSSPWSCCVFSLTCLGFLIPFIVLSHQRKPPTEDATSPLEIQEKPLRMDDIVKRGSLLLAFAFFQGASLGNLIQLAIEVDPRLILTAFLGTFTVFACFSISALFARRKTYLFLGGFLSSCLSNLIWLGLFNLFFQTEFLFLVSLYGGLFLFGGFVLYDTQVILEKINCGDNDFLRHSLELYLDFINIFVRILIILIRNRRK
jgi:FtsH-binding integral membrane protein